MYKIYTINGCNLNGYAKKIVHVMKITTFIICAAFIQVSATGIAQKINFVKNAVTLNKIFKVINKQTGYNIVWSSSQVDDKKEVNVAFKNTPLVEALNECLSHTGLTYTIENKTIVVTKRYQQEIDAVSAIVKPIEIPITGKVVNQKGEALEGISVSIKGIKGKGTRTSKDGSFAIQVPNNDVVLVFSSVGYAKAEVPVNGRTFIEVRLKESVGELAGVVVKGIRAAQQNSLNIKRRSNEFLDAITAEDAGKLPDKNIAEALQRVPGIAIQRNRGEGDFISIRGLGPQFVEGTINGRTLVSATESLNSTISGGQQSSTGRETNYDILPSELIESIEVFKTGAAEQTEGGIGGVVNIKTAKPLTLGNKYAFSVRGNEYTFNNKVSGDFSGIGSWVNQDKTFGGLLNVNYSNRRIREDIAESFGYGPEGLFGAKNTFDTNGGGKANVTNVYFPFSSNLESFNEERKRFTVNGALQWAPSANTNISLDLLYSCRNLFHATTQLIFLTQPLGSYIGTPATNPDGSVVWPGLKVSSSNTATNYSIKSLDVSPVYDEQKSTDNVYNTGLNITHKTSDGWKFNFDAAYARADGAFGFQRIVFEKSAASLPIDVNITPNYIVATPQSPDALSAANLVTRNTQITNRTNHDREYSIKTDAEKTVNSSFISSLKFGFRYSNREKDISESDGGVDRNAAKNPVVLNATNVPNAPGVSNFLGGGFPLNYSNVSFPTNINQIYNQLIQAGAVKTDTYNPNQSFNVNEQTFGGYFQANLKGTLGDVPFTGNVGVRLVNTKSDVTSFIQSFTITQGAGGVGIPNPTGGITNVSTNSSYTSFLPSLNLKFQASDNAFFRVAFSKSLTRPLFSDLGGLSVNFTQLFVNKYGNSALKPYESSNYDAGFEWYTPGGGIISTNFFYKNLASFITNVTTNNVTFLGVQYRSFSQPENQAGGSILGNEITFQQPFKFLPGFLSGFGVIANFTFSDGKLNLNNGQPSAFPGVSRNSLNSALYYDNGGKFQARLAYTYRGKYLVLPSDVFAQEIWHNSYGQLDGSVNYEIKKGFNIFADVTNLNNAIDRTFSSSTASPAYDQSRPLSYGYTGIRIALGLRLTL